MSADILPRDFERLLVALLIGILIGLERERSEARKSHKLFAGVRTFPLIALAGAAPMLILDITGPALLVVAFVAVAATALVSYARTSASGDLGATTEMAAISTFLLGTLAGAGDLHVAAAVGIGVAILLAAKPRIEAFSQALSSEELAATLELAVISVIILPLLPDREYGPWQVLNPFNIWLMVVLVSSLSFAGFVAMRLWGARQGLVIAGVVGALVSSTAVTMAMSARSRAHSDLASVAAAATVLACTIMCVRVGILAGIVDVGILPRLLPVLLVMVVSGTASAWLLARRAPPRRESSPETTLANPFSLREALSFGAVYAIVLMGARAGEAYFGAGGMYIAAVFSALVDVDAVTIAFTRLGPTGDVWRIAAAAVTLAVVTNTVVKLGIAMVAGAPLFRRGVAFALGVMAVLGGLAGVCVFTHL
ncbi:MAG: MgtC/SapB family protein [Candidatus Binatia bacterium]